jgi:hypothetical protein
MNSIFYVEFKYVVSFFLIRQDFLSDMWLKFKENLYLHCITDSVYFT